MGGEKRREEAKCRRGKRANGLMRVRWEGSGICVRLAGFGNYLGLRRSSAPRPGRLLNLKSADFPGGTNKKSKLQRSRSVGLETATHQPILALNVHVLESDPNALWRRDGRFSVTSAAELLFHAANAFSLSGAI